MDHDRNTGTTWQAPVPSRDFSSHHLVRDIGSHECMHETYEQMNKYRDIETMCDMELENENVSCQNGRQIT